MTPPMTTATPSDRERIATLKRDLNHAWMAATIAREVAGEYETRLERAEAALAQAREERDGLLDQLALRSDDNRARDMQEVMRVNNELLAALAQAREALEPFARLAEALLKPNPWIRGELQMVLMPNSSASRSYVTADQLAAVAAVAAGLAPLQEETT